MLEWVAVAGVLRNKQCVAFAALPMVNQVLFMIVIPEVLEPTWR